MGERSPRWEPEPLRWLGVNAAIGLNRAADYFERRTQRPAKLIDKIMERLGMY